MAKTTALEKLKSVYLIYGVERYLLDEALERLKTIVAAGGDLTLNFEKFTPGASADQIIGACQSIPFLAERRLVVVEDYESLSPDDKSKLADYVSDPSPYAILVLVQHGANKTGKVKVDKRTRLFKAADAGGQAYEYKLDAAGLDRWIKEAFLNRNKVVTDEAVAYLREAVANDLWRMDSEIEKISQFADEIKKIDIEQVRSVASASPETGVFDLIGALVGGKRQESLLLLSRLLEDREAAGRIFYVLEDQLRLIIRAKAQLDKGIPDREAAGILKVSPGRIYYLKNQSRAFSYPQLKRALGLIAQADLQRKTGQLEPKLILEKLVVDMEDLLEVRPS